MQEYVRELLDQEQKFLIFAHHQVLMDGIQEVLNKRAPVYRPVLPFSFVKHCPARHCNVC